MIRCVISLSCFLITSTLWAQELVSYKDSDSIIRIGNRCLFLEDPTNRLTLETILDNKNIYAFKAVNEEIPNMGNTSSTYWCAFTIHNTSGENLFLEFRKALFDEVEFFYPDSGKHYRSILTGTNFPRSTRQVEDNYFIFKIPAASASQTYYLRVKSISNISFPLSIGAAQHMFSKHRDEEFLYGLYIGLILTLAIYNLFVLLAVRDRNYLYYILYLLLNLSLYDLSAIGFGLEYVWGDSLLRFSYYSITDILVTAAVFVNLLFLSSFLDLKKKIPFIYKINTWVYFICVLIVVINFIKLPIDLPFTQVLILLSCFYFLYIIVYAYYRKIRTSRFLLLGWAAYIGSIIIYELFILGYLPYTNITLNAIPVGTSFEALFFSFALADRIRELRNEKLLAQQQNLDLIQNQNKILEQRVHERTLEIAMQNEEISAQNEELVTLQDQLSIQNENLELQNSELTKARKIIEVQNSELRKQATNLEDEVKKKASDLVVSNQELIKHNHQLQQFSFITAHNLRSPVARILGLINLLGLDDSKNEEQQAFILQQIEKSGQELDLVIRDLTLLLDIKKGITEEYESVPLLEKLNRIQLLLQAELKKNNVTLNINVPEKETVQGHSAYVESILFNLISNAIKYRSLSRDPSITITTLRDNGFLTISVHDNGLGIDLEKQRSKIFAMYQRFHFHVEGRGLGLHLVKTQVESMGGKIFVNSKIDEGTTFEIVLPTTN